MSDPALKSSHTTRCWFSDDYVQSFLTHQHPYDYAKQLIVYPKESIYRQYCDRVIRQGKAKTPWAANPIALKKCKPSLLKFHLQESTRRFDGFIPQTSVVTGWDSKLKEEVERVYGAKWILVSYYSDSWVNFIQVDIDRHGPEDEDKAKHQVSLLEDAARRYGFEIVWTTSPGYLDESGSFVHGLYAWIRLDESQMVMDIKHHVRGFLYSIGLEEIVRKGEGAYLKEKKLVRLPGQFNVELANPLTFEKLYRHTPVSMGRSFAERGEYSGVSEPTLRGLSRTDLSSSRPRSRVWTMRPSRLAYSRMVRGPARLTDPDTQTSRSSRK